MPRGRKRKPEMSEIDIELAQQTAFYDITDDMPKVEPSPEDQVVSEVALVEQDVSLDQVDIEDLLLDFNTNDSETVDTSVNETVSPASISSTLDSATAVALSLAEDDFVLPEPTKLDGDPNDPHDERSFKTCTNEKCHFKAGCLRWRLRKQREEYKTQGFYFADQDNCLVRADEYLNVFALDPIEDWDH